MLEIVYLNFELSENLIFINILFFFYHFLGPPPKEGWAVIAWLHSGDFNYGSPSDIDPFQFVIKQKVIVVTIAYRLNIFGFFTTMDGEAPGNVGLMDQSAALLWVKNHIKLFGGNEESITIMGHGSGAISAGLHLTSDVWSANSFHKAIIMSGSSFWDAAVREPKTYTSSLDRTAASFGCFRRPTSLLIDCLRQIPAQVLVEQDPSQDWGPVIDDGLSNTTAPFIPDYPRNMATRGALRKVPVMIGYTDMEDVLDLSLGSMMEEGISEDMYQTLIEDIVLNDVQQLDANETCGGNNKIIIDAVNFVYKPFPPVTDGMMLREKYVDFNTDRKYAAPTFQLASEMSKLSETYVYRFDIRPKTSGAVEGIPEWITVPHRYELIFVWGFPYWSMLPENAVWDAMDKSIANIIMPLWANFAKFTIPSKVGVYVKWDQFTEQNPGVLIIDRSFNMSDPNSMHYQGLKFWNNYYPEVMEFATQCCNVTESFSPNLQIATSIKIVIITSISLSIFSRALNMST